MPLAALLHPGRALILTGNLLYAMGAFKADYNHTHIFNDNWPPHAKFHTGQTLTLGTLLASTSTFFLYRAGSYSSSSKTGLSTDAALTDLRIASWIGSMYCLAGLAAIWYPGTDWVDPEFRRPGPGENRPQLPLFVGIVAAMWVGYGLEKWRMGR